MSTLYTTKELRDIKAMRARGHSLGEIAERYGRTYTAIRALFHRMPGYAGVWRDRGIAHRTKNLVPPPREMTYAAHAVHSVQVGNDRWEDRDRRLNEPRDITGRLMGDPPPSQSALGRPCT